MPKRARPESPEPEPEEVPRIKLSDLPAWNKLGPDAEWDKEFVEQVLRETGPQAAHASKKLKKEQTWGDSSARKMTTLLSNARLPTVSNNYLDAINDPISSAVPSQPQNNQFKSTPKVEALYLTPAQASTYLTQHNVHPDIPIFVNGQPNDQLTSHPTKRPLERFFDWQEDLDRKVCVQDPTNMADKDSYKTKTLAEVKEHFFNNKPNTNEPIDEIIKDNQPWNVLDIGNPLPNGYPRWLSDIQFQLLHRVKDHVLRQKLGTRITATTEHWATWTDVTDWCLLSEGGNLTTGHQDAHALDTWIQVQEGAFGFGWMARPTHEEHIKWMTDPNKEPNATAGNKWRYVILKPGQTVYFPAGLTHFVFRTKGYQTLATGGHNIRWNALPRWLQMLELQHLYPDCINEELSKTKQYVEAIKHLLQQRVKHDTAKDLFPGGMWGNKTANQYFKDVLAEINAPNKPWSPKPRRATGGKKPAGGSRKK